MTIPGRTRRKHTPYKPGRTPKFDGATRQSDLKSAKQTRSHTKSTIKRSYT